MAALVFPRSESKKCIPGFLLVSSMENPDSIWQKTGEMGRVITEDSMESWDWNCIKQKDRRGGHEKLECWVREMSN